MLDSLAHRGPDSRGTYSDRNLAFGANRLSIVDLESGSQPITNEEGTIVVVFNGEIYNFRRLRAELESKGHKFTTKTDTEVLVHLYEEKRGKLVDYLRGMFAFALWDSEENKLLLGRDRFGIKPLYYTQVGNKLTFASEIKALLKDSLSDFKLSQKAVRTFLKLRYIGRTSTIFKSVKEVPPGNLMVCGIEKSDNKYSGRDKQLQIRTRRYWSCRPRLKSWQDSKLEDKIKQEVETAVKKRLMGDVPLGIFISGGLDSTAILNYASKNYKRQIKTYSLQFHNDSADETKYARLAADHYATDHTIVPFNRLNIDLLQDVVWHLDQPMADPTAIPTYLLSQKASEDCKFILTGEGADEVFGGYEQYRYLLMKSEHPSIIRWLSYLVPNYSQYGFKRRLKKVMREGDTSRVYSLLVSIFSDEELEKFFDMAPAAESLFRNYFSSKEGISSMLKFDVENWLVKDVLMKLDKMLMANSLEGRVPFLDLEVYRTGSSLPAREKIWGGRKKHALKTSLQGEIPDKIRKRRKKRFFVPLDTYFKGEFKERALQILEDPKVFDLWPDIKFAGVDKLLETMNSWGYKLIEKRSDKSRMYYLRQLWNVLNLELWYQRLEDRLND